MKCIKSRKNWSQHKKFEPTDPNRNDCAANNSCNHRHWPFCFLKHVISAFLIVVDILIPVLLVISVFIYPSPVLESASAPALLSASAYIYKRYNSRKPVALIIKVSVLMWVVFTIGVLLPCGAFFAFKSLRLYFESGYGPAYKSWDWPFRYGVFGTLNRIYELLKARI